MRKICCLHILHCLLLGSATGTAQECADISFHTSAKSCCNGTLHFRGGRKCCTGELYDPNQKICCNNSVHDQEDGICCGSELHKYLQAPYVCCGGIMHHASQKSCCGGQELYDPATQICCEFNGLHSVSLKDNKSCCFDKNYDINTQHCVGNNVLAQNQELCGNTTFNIELKVCCGKTLHENPPYPYRECCGEELFDRNKNQCCKAHKKVVPQDQECCGKGSIDKTSEICCIGIAHLKKGNMTCCGSELVDGVTTGCCAAKPYNTSTHTCCRNDKSIHLNQSCGGSVGYDKRTHQCKNGYQVVKKRNPIKYDARPGICRACVRDMSDLREQIKMERLSVCKKYKFKVYTSRVPMRSGQFWIMHGKLVKTEVDKRNVRLIIPCKCGQLNKTGEYVLLTDIDVMRRTLRLGDSDLFLQHNQRLETIISRKRKKCRIAGSSWFVRRLKNRVMEEVGEFIDRILPKERF